MRSKVDLEIAFEVLEVIGKHRVLSTMELCRECNGYGKDNYQICHKNMEFGAIRTWDNPCTWQTNGCKIKYKTLYSGGHSGLLWYLVKRGILHTKLRRFWDKGKALPTDKFRFWFLEECDYNKIVLKQTLEPYLEEL